MPAVLGDYFALQRGTTYKSAMLGQAGPVLLGLGSIARNGGFKGENLKTYGGPCDPRHLLTPGEMYVSLKDVTQSADLLGAVARVPSYIPLGRLTQDTVKLVFKAEDAPRTYLYWLLQTPQYREYCRAHSTGTTNLGLAREDFLNFEVPPLTFERQWIVGLVQKIEDKIELNRRMNDTLEAMAQTIFRDWFIDFGPVRRKLEGATDPVAIMGRLTHDADRAAELAGLFPDGLGQDELPSGWRLMSLSDVADQCKGAVNPQTLPDTLFEHFSLPAHDAGQEPAHDLGVSIKSNKVPIPAGSVLVSKLNPEILRVWIPSEPAGIPQVASTEFLVFTPKPVAGRALLYFLFRDPIVRQVMEGMVTGTSKSHQRISPPALLQAKLVVGDEVAFAAFEEIAEPMLQRGLALRAENRTLAETRDYLLPRLMSGEVRVGDVQSEAAA
jgi:type I restriction enzyme S subunit